MKAQIRNIYHTHKGIDGYRSMTVYLARRGYVYSPETIHKYMNTEMGLRFVIRTLQKALDSQPAINGGLILHSDQGTQYTAKTFVDFCEFVNITQSMSKVGYPYDNAPMEHYFNILKNECTNLYEFAAEEILYEKAEEFAYVDHNHVRPHSFNGYRTPYEIRMSV